MCSGPPSSPPSEIDYWKAFNLFDESCRGGVVGEKYVSAKFMHENYDPTSVELTIKDGSVNLRATKDIAKENCVCVEVLSLHEER